MTTLNLKHNLLKKINININKFIHLWTVDSRPAMMMPCGRRRRARRTEKGKGRERMEEKRCEVEKGTLHLGE
mgnify:CR=1 FL=1